MNKLRVIIPLVSLLILGCQSPKIEKISNRSDYSTYLFENDTLSQNLARINGELRFWQNKSKSQPNSHLYLVKRAGLLAWRFKLTGEISDIYRSDELLNQARIITNSNQASIYHSLAANAVTKHQFKLASQYLSKAWELGEEKLTSILLMFDVNMELGFYSEAKELLDLIENKSTFDYLIRYSKLKDQQGDLDSAIMIMEQALTRVKGNGSTATYCWALSNLGDMYGHAGRIKESYQSYLQVLNKNPQYYYALKGIAWIAYSHDRNAREATEILDFLKKKNSLPDHLLLEAEIAEFRGDSKTSGKLRQEFMSQASQAQYMDMYNKYLALIATESLNNYDYALALARHEVINRATPQSYDLLAWNYYQQGDLNKAHQIAESKIRDQSFEPEILHHLGVIYHSKGESLKARKYLKMALESSFELGPLTSAKIRQLLNS